jgi:hypothetical protein
MSWAAEKVIESAGIDPKDADEYLVALAEKCLAKCYYIDRAADEMLRVLDGWRQRF